MPRCKHSDLRVHERHNDQVACSNCGTRWSVHSTQKHVTQFMARLRATGAWPPPKKGTRL